MRRLLFVTAFGLGSLVIALGLLAAVAGGSRATSPFRRVAQCDAGHVWLTRSPCLSTFWCPHDADESLFLEWDGDDVTIGTRFTEQPASPELKRALFRELEAIQEDPTRRAVDIAGMYEVQARCQGAHAFASATGADPNLKDYLRSASLRDWPMFLRWEFTGAAWHTKRSMSRLRRELGGASIDERGAWLQAASK